MIKELHEHLGLLAGIFASLTLMIPKIRKILSAVISGLWIMIRAPWLLIEIQKDVRFVKSQVVQNGGSSLKDATARLEYAVRRQESFRRHEFWTKGRPAMEMDSEGFVLIVSEATCHLFGVSDPQNLYRRSWVQHIDQERMSDFLDSLIDAAKSESGFRMSIDLYSRDRTLLGLWEFRACPINGEVATQKCFSGHWSPVSDVAIEIAQRHHWAI